MAHYLIFGDSITCGEGDLHGGWVQYLREALTNDIIYNLGIDGETTTGLVNRLEKEIKPRLSEDDPNIVVIAIGVNDSSFSKSANQCQVALDIFKQNLIQLIKLARKYTQKIIFVGPAPVDQSKTDPTPCAPELSYNNELIKKYSGTIKLICRQEKLRFIDLFNNLKPDYINCLDDGLHPNHTGQGKIYKIVVKNIQMC